MSSLELKRPVRTMPPWAVRKVMVTGANGFLGSHLCHHLCQMGGEVYATSRTQRSNLKGGPIWWQTNLEDIGAVRSLFAKVKPDVIFHFSGLASGVQAREFVLPTFHSLLTSTVNILTVATEFDCRRIVLIGSLNESLPNNVEVIPSSPYAAAKWASSVYGRMFHALYGTPVVIVRPFMTYGPGQGTHKLLPSVVHSLLKGEVPKLTNGYWKADWIYIDDVIEGFVAVAQVPQIEGATFDLGSGKLVTVREMIHKLVVIMDTSIQPGFGVLPDRAWEPERNADVSEAFEKLGWRANVSLQNGLQRTVEWYKAQLHASSKNPSTKILLAD